MADEEELHVLHMLMDPRFNLNGTQAMQVADMSHEDRVAMLASLVRAAHEQALFLEERRRDV